MPDNMLSNPTSPFDSFRALQWAPVVQGGTVADFIAAGSDSTMKETILPDKEPPYLPCVVSAQTSLCGQPSVLQRNLSGTYYSIAKPIDSMIGHPLSRQASEGHIRADNVSSCLMPSLEGKKFSHIFGNDDKSALRVVGSGTDWSMKTFSELVASSRGE
eukprot:c18040_g1_i2 orf=348-824(+)